MRRALGYTVFGSAFVMSCAFGSAASAVDLTWTGNVSTDWNTTGNWFGTAGVPPVNFFGPPTNQDAATIDNGDTVLLSQITASVDALDVLNGSRLLTNGRSLNASTPTDGALLHVGDAGSVVSVSSLDPGAVGTHGLFVDRIAVDAGGTIGVTSFGLQPGRARASVQAVNNGVLFGDGVMEFGGGGAIPGNRALVNNAAIRPATLFGGGRLILAAVSGRTLDLDGDAETTAFLDADVSAFAPDEPERTELIIDGPLTDPFNGTLHIGRDDFASFTDRWDLEGTIDFRGTIAQPATLTGAIVDANAGSPAINVSSGAAVIDASLAMRTGRITAHNSGTLLRIQQITGLSLDAEMELDAPTGVTLDIQSHFVIEQPDFDLDGRENNTVFVGTGSSLEVNADSIDPDDGAFDGFLASSGSLRVITPGASWTNRGVLAFEQVTDRPVLVSSSVVNEVGGRVRGDVDSANHGLTNRGRLDVGPVGGAGLMTFDNFTQEGESAVAVFDLGGANEPDFDRLTAEQVHVGGDLFLALFNGYDPATGVSHVIVEDDFGPIMTGVFETVAGVALSGGRAWAVTYTPREVRATAALAGDANLSGQVEQGDLDAVLQNWGKTSAVDGISWATGDLNGSGQVEQGDLDAVLQNWGDTAAPDLRGFVVPEPAVGLLLLAGFARLRPRDVGGGST